MANQERLLLLFDDKEDDIVLEVSQRGEELLIEVEDEGSYGARACIALTPEQRAQLIRTLIEQTPDWETLDNSQES